MILHLMFPKDIGKCPARQGGGIKQELVLSLWHRYKRFKPNQFHGILSVSSQGKAVWGDSCTIGKTNKIVDLNLSRMDLVACA